MGRRHEQTILQKRHTKGQQTHEKLFNITCPQRNINQNYIVRMAKISKVGKKKCWRGCGERGTLLTLLVGMQAGIATLENSIEFPQEVKNRATL